MSGLDVINQLYKTKKNSFQKIFFFNFSVYLFLWPFVVVGCTSNS